MPKQVFVRGHYRKVRKSSKLREIILVVGVLIIFSIMWIQTAWVSFAVVASIIVCCAILIIVLRWQHKRHIRRAPDIRPAIQSRYIPKDIRQFVLERDNHQCQLCNSNLYPEIDHIIPLAKGGSNHPDNLQVLCRGCNSQKGARV